MCDQSFGSLFILQSAHWLIPLRAIAFEHVASIVRLMGDEKKEEFEWQLTLVPIFVTVTRGCCNPGPQFSCVVTTYRLADYFHSLIFNMWEEKQFWTCLVPPLEADTLPLMLKLWWQIIYITSNVYTFKMVCNGLGLQTTKTFRIEKLSLIIDIMCFIFLMQWLLYKQRDYPY